MKYLNLGCGVRFHPAWTNVNFTSSGAGVIAANLSKGIPFPDKTFDVVYHSHLIEHFPKSEAPLLIEECFRVLRPNGVIRIAAPDLENIAKQYLLSLESAKLGVDGSSDNYDWMLLEMYDQVVRNQPGGDMACYLFRKNISNKDFVITRCGLEVKRLIEQAEVKPLPSFMTNKTTWIGHLKRAGKFILKSNFRKEALLKLLLKDEYAALQIGRFRLSGENHLWMYDTFSLGRMLKKSGFSEIMKQTAFDSYIEDWRTFHLDSELDGSVYKPDSLYIEARKP